ncbi:MAG TPA: TRAP transporter substrate-binding protein [Burkholderiales bacterium]|jgi:TRAP-type C4-dicarboxylate transport system substrate-binding protein|nr:TRAP transporter substrate-binding protein [Burkholderiales bacterium]
MFRLAMAPALALLLACPAFAQQKYEVKVAEFVGAQHFMTIWLMKWGEKLEKASGGRLVFKHFPGAQMAPAPAHYDLARTGQADVAWFLHGGTPGRFPLTELISLPYMVGSAEIGTKVLNDAQLRSKYLDAEHKGVHVLLLLTHQPGNVHTTKVPIRTTNDFKGLRIRFAAPTIRDFVAALGGTPVGVPPPDQLEQLQKGTLDGVFIDYGGAGIAFKMGGTLKYSTEMYSYVSSFGVAMNPDFYAKLPADLKKMVDDSVKGVEKEVGEGWDALDAIGKKALLDGGDQPIKLSPAEDAKFRKIGAGVTDAKIKELEGKGLPARAVHDMMVSLSEKNAKTSKNFWQ